MTLTLGLLRDRYVFESTPQRHNLGVLHVRFDDLVGDARTESRLLGAVSRNEPCAVIGASGSGKSSVIAHVLDPQAEGIAPLVVPIAAMPSTAIDTPDHLVHHLVTSISRQAAAAVDVDVDAAIANRTETVTTTRKSGVAAGWGWFKGDLAREVKRQTEIEHTAGLAEKTDVLSTVLETIKTESDLQPVIVFDDTDRWLTSESKDLVRGFFGESLRWLLELGTGVVAAVHPAYFELAPQAELLQYLDSQITIPHLSGADAIREIIVRRVELYAEDEGPDLSGVITDDALLAIHDVYDESRSLRRAIQVCYIAVHEALDAGDAELTSSHIVAAAHAG